MEGMTVPEQKKYINIKNEEMWKEIRDTIRKEIQSKKPFIIQVNGYFLRIRRCKMNNIDVKIVIN